MRPPRGGRKDVYIYDVRNGGGDVRSARQNRGAAEAALVNGLDRHRVRRLRFGHFRAGGNFFGVGPTCHVGALKPQRGTIAIKLFRPHR